MATSYSANQFDDAFRPKRLQRWEVPKYNLSSRPGVTRGAPGLYRSNTGAWGSFIGTWELPKKLPGNYIDDPMAREASAYEKLHRDFEETKLRLTGSKFNYRLRPRTLPPLTAADGLSSSAQGNRSGRMTPTDGDQPGTGSESDEDQQMTSSQRVSFSNKIPVPDLSGPFYVGGGRNEDQMLCAL